MRGLQYPVAKRPQSMHWISACPLNFHLDTISLLAMEHLDNYTQCISSGAALLSRNSSLTRNPYKDLATPGR